MPEQKRYAVRPEWVHVKYAESGEFREVYGFASAGGMVNLEGIRFVPEGRPPKTLAPATGRRHVPRLDARARAR